MWRLPRACSPWPGSKALVPISTSDLGVSGKKALAETSSGPEKWWLSVTPQFLLETQLPSTCQLPWNLASLVGTVTCSRTLGYAATMLAGSAPSCLPG